MDVLDLSDYEVLLIPVHWPAVGIQNHVSRNYVPPKGMLPFVDDLNAIGRLVAMPDWNGCLVSRVVGIGSTTQSLPNSVLMKQRT